MSKNILHTNKNKSTMWGWCIQPIYIYRKIMQNVYLLSDFKFTKCLQLILPQAQMIIIPNDSTCIRLGSCVPDSSGCVQEWSLQAARCKFAVGDMITKCLILAPEKIQCWLIKE